MNAKGRNFNYAGSYAMSSEQQKQKSDRKGSAFSKGLCDNYVDDGLERGNLAREANWKPLLCYKREAKTEVL